MKKINIAEVAKAARVSTTTVSRVINQIASVSEENRRRVLGAIERLKYHPNPNAQRLASGKTNTVALLIPRFEGIFHSYYALQVLKGVGVSAEQARCDLLLHITTGQTMMNPAAVDGLLFIDLDGNERMVGTLPDIGAYEKQ